MNRRQSNREAEMIMFEYKTGLEDALERIFHDIVEGFRAKYHDGNRGSGRFKRSIRKMEDPFESRRRKGLSTRGSRRRYSTNKDNGCRCKRNLMYNYPGNDL